MTSKQRRFCRQLADDLKDLVRARQQAVFKHGKFLASLLAQPPLNSVTATCQQDVFFCLQLLEDAVISEEDVLRK